MTTINENQVTEGLDPTIPQTDLVNLQDLKDEFDADLASLSQDELLVALENAGVFDAAGLELAAEPPHIDDWLAEPPVDETDRFVKEWLEHFRRPADEQDKNWLNSRLVTCEYEGKRHRCTGCSSMGDVWLTSDMNQKTGYQKRVSITDISNWAVLVLILGELQEVMINTLESVFSKLGVSLVKPEHDSPDWTLKALEALNYPDIKLLISPDSSVEQVSLAAMKLSQTIRARKSGIAEVEPVERDGVVYRQPASPKTQGRNEPCACGSGVKYKNCHLKVKNEPEPKKDEP